MTAIIVLLCWGVQFCRNPATRMKAAGLCICFIYLIHISIAYWLVRFLKNKWNVSSLILFIWFFPVPVPYWEWMCPVCSIHTKRHVNYVSYLCYAQMRHHRSFTRLERLFTDWKRTIYCLERLLVVKKRLFTALSLFLQNSEFIFDCMMHIVTNQWTRIINVI